MMEAQRSKLKLCPVRISNDPDPVLQERLNAERQANNERILAEQRRRTLESIAREQEQEEGARTQNQQNNCA
ncbi:hypothetical protein LTR70_004223 [Exophiala xenobiotica]|uniref:Uncharacterized protein n=1 Tax=Lithohypha guttulata TaxID=1690604 RepID=A0ABR0KEA0_9EURO|nr:hypothetical protein LTR24_003705 [Lithohypha guttulata]KAK5321510.1 hypothetical protein LTR70_004223 [Exophiala xenobiotica]